MKKTGLFANGLIWVGAAVSIAEIEAGTLVGGNWLALIAGHLLGGLMLAAVGLIGALTGKNAMSTTSASFGVSGMRFFAVLNVLQLVGWTAVMIAQGGEAVTALTGWSHVLPMLACAVLLGVGVFVAFGDRLRLATVAMGALALLAAVLTVKLIAVPPSTGVAPVGFRTAFEISVAMPLSWLPLISDYTSTAERPRLASGVSAAAYTLVSMWMYALGMLITRMGGTSLADAIVKSGIGTIGLAVIVFSTVTTTFLDAYSGGESVKAIFPRSSAKRVGVLVCALGGGLAVAGLMEHFTGFLYLISSVFAPMATVLIVDRYVVKRGRVGWNFAAWFAGVLVYRFASDFPVGPTLAAILASVTVAFLPVFAGRRDENQV